MMLLNFLTNLDTMGSQRENVWTQGELCVENPLKWSLKGVPNVEELCCFLKSWRKSQQASKPKIGHFYIAIDENLQRNGFRPDNAYRFIQRVVQSKLRRNPY